MIRPGSVYSLHPSYARESVWMRTLPEKTGKTLEQWIEDLNANGPAELNARRDWMKTRHPAIGMNYAWWIVDCAAGTGLAKDYDPDALVDELFDKKPNLRPIYEELLRRMLALGDDVKACPCQTMVPLYRGNVFAQLKPTTKTRIDVGLCLRDRSDLPPRLIDTGGLAKGDRITHRIPVQSVADMDDELKTWIKAAYDSCP